MIEILEIILKNMQTSPVESYHKIEDHTVLYLLSLYYCSQEFQQKVLKQISLKSPRVIRNKKKNVKTRPLRKIFQTLTLETFLKKMISLRKHQVIERFVDQNDDYLGSVLFSCYETQDFQAIKYIVSKRHSFVEMIVYSYHYYDPKRMFLENCKALGLDLMITKF